MSIPRGLARNVLLASLSLGILSGCGGDQGGLSGRLLVGPLALAASLAPRPTSAEGSLALLEWCWDHQSADRYRTLFTDDYLATCGDPTQPDLQRDEEVASVRRVFTTARLIRFAFASPPAVLPDSRPGHTDPWYREARAITTALIVDRSGERLRVDEVVRFFLVRGDSALIPVDLKEEGVRQDASCWFIQGWESLGPAPGSLDGGSPSGGSLTNWCDLKRQVTLSSR